MKQQNGFIDPAIALLAIGGVAVLGLLFVGGPMYNVWQQSLSGKAELNKAEYTRQVAVLEAQAKKDSAQQLADADSVITEKLKLIISTKTSIDKLGKTMVYVFQPCEVLYRTPSVSGVRTIIQVLRYLPARVKNFGFDFYTTLKPYSDEYTDFYENQSWRLGHANDFIQRGEYVRSMRAKDFSEHDPVSNFCFAQNLYKAGLFEIEPYGASILALTPYQYVERLEEMLGDW